VAILKFCGPTAEYITVCRPDRTALLEGNLPREMLDDLLKQSYVRQVGNEDEKRVTTFRLTADGKKVGTKKQAQG